MRSTKIMFCLLGMASWLLMLSVYGFVTTSNSLYIIAITLASTAITFAIYCLYQPLCSQAGTKKDFYFYFIDNSPASREKLNRDLGRRIK